MSELAATSAVEAIVKALNEAIGEPDTYEKRDEARAITQAALDSWMKQD